MRRRPATRRERSLGRDACQRERRASSRRLAGLVRCRALPAVRCIAQAQATPAAHNAVSAAQAAWKPHVVAIDAAAGDESRPARTLPTCGPVHAMARKRSSRPRAAQVRKSSASSAPDRKPSPIATSRLATTSSGTPAPSQQQTIAATCTTDPSRRLARCPNLSANQPVGTSSRSSATSPAARMAATTSGGSWRLLHPPQQVQTMSDAFEARDSVRQVEREVPTVAGSIWRHFPQSSRISTSAA